MQTLKQGARGEAVKTLQALLGVTADGIFGQATLKAVKGFQAARGLACDGIVGQKTWAALGIKAEDVTIPCEDLKQYASPHGSMVYGPDSSYSTYKSGGCGVVSFAIVYRALGLAPAGETSTQTIQRLGAYAWQHGFRIKGGGTSAGLFATNGCGARRVAVSGIADAVRAGRPVILLIRKGFGNGYAGSGHYIVAYGVQGDGLLLRDVGSGKAARQVCPLNKLGQGLKGAWEVTKDE